MGWVGKSRHPECFGDGVGGDWISEQPVSQRQGGWGCLDTQSDSEMGVRWGYLGLH